jgi:endo-1,4-beta-xylanase
MQESKILLLMLISISLLSGFSECQLANGKTKFFGNILGNYIPTNFKSYWNQITLEWLGKWSFV